MKKTFLTLFVVFISTSAFSQILKNGTYKFNFCDIEYNKCIGKCKVILKGSKIWIYAPSGLTGIKEGELFDAGTLIQDPSRKWLVLQSEKDKKNIKNNIRQVPAWVDFKRKRYWTF